MKPDKVLLIALRLYNVRYQSTRLGLMAVKFESTLEPSEGLGKTQTSGAHPQYLL